MISLNRKTAAVLVAGGAAAAIAAGVSGAALASTTTPTPTATSGSSSPAQAGQPAQARGEHGAGRGWGKGWGKGGRLEAAALAKQLGIDEAKLRQAVDAVRAELKAERTAARTDGTTAPKPGAGSDDFANRLAKQLGISPEKVKTAISTVRAAARAAREQALTNRLQQAVQDGKLTQAEADAVQKAVKLGIIGRGQG